MFLSNFWRLVTPGWKYNGGQDYFQFSNGQRDTSGTVRNNTYQIPYTTGSQHLTSSTRPFRDNVLRLALGTGTTDVDPDDYCLDNDVTNSFSGVTTSLTTTYEQGKLKVIFAFNGTNASGNELTITEVGAILKNSDDNYNAVDYLVARQLLDEPIVVPANGVLNKIVTLEMT